ncbi:unnamed protein product [Linum trigynum]|uniref:Uncharacterized protein n=1 Tax=Linum trigynum TaxID=586398 RepID=A0AAV2EV99_9ROSI
MYNGYLPQLPKETLAIRPLKRLCRRDFDIYTDVKKIFGMPQVVCYPRNWCFQFWFNPLNPEELNFRVVVRCAHSFQWQT